MQEKLIIIKTIKPSLTIRERICFIKNINASIKSLDYCSYSPTVHPSWLFDMLECVQLKRGNVCSDYLKCCMTSFSHRSSCSDVLCPDPDSPANGDKQKTILSQAVQMWRTVLRLGTTFKTGRKMLSGGNGRKVEPKSRGWALNRNSMLVVVLLFLSSFWDLWPPKGHLYNDFFSQKAVEVERTKIYVHLGCSFVVTPSTLLLHQSSSPSNQQY